MKLTKRQLATILAALRYFQRTRGDINKLEWTEYFEDFFEGDNGPPLTDKQIDRLCEKINSGYVEFIAVAIEGNDL